MTRFPLRAVAAGVASAFAVVAHAQSPESNPIGKLKTRFTMINLFDRFYRLRDGTGIGVGAPQYASRRSFDLAVSKPF